MRRSNGYGVLVGTGALGGAAIALGIATFSVMSGDGAPTDSIATAVADRPLSGVSVRSPESAGSIGVSAAPDLQDVQLATELAPFEESRVWSGERYQLPGESVTVQAEPQAPPREPEPAPDFAVLGTAASAGAGLAVIRVGSGTPQLVAVGERVEGYQVASIEDGNVTMRNGDRSLRLSVAMADASPAQTARAEAQRLAQARNQGNAARGDGNQAAARTPAGFAPPPGATAIEAGMRRAEELARTMGQGARIQMNGNEVTVLGPNGQRYFFQISDRPAPPAERRQ